MCTLDDVLVLKLSVLFPQIHDVMVGSVYSAIEEVVAGAILILLVLEVLVGLSVLLKLSSKRILMLGRIVESIILRMSMTIMTLCVVMASTSTPTSSLYSLSWCSLSRTELCK